MKSKCNAKLFFFVLSIETVMLKLCSNYYQNIFFFEIIITKIFNFKWNIKK